MNTRIWLDQHLPVDLSIWLRRTFDIDGIPIRELGLREASDEEIFQRARTVGASVMTKDEDFCLLVQRYGPPPQVLWLRCGNCTNDQLRVFLKQHLPSALEDLSAGVPLILVG